MVNEVQLMHMQNEFESFYQDIRLGDESDLRHSFVNDNNIYFHATELKNLESILKNGFIASQMFNCCYFGKSFHSCKGYFNNKNVPCAVLAVDLSTVFQEDKISFVCDTEIRVHNSVRPEHIIGYLKFE